MHSKHSGHLAPAAWCLLVAVLAQVLTCVPTGESSSVDGYSTGQQFYYIHHSTTAH